MDKQTKRITFDKNYVRPNKTYQEQLTKQEIKEKLNGYKELKDIKKLSIGSHVRYFTFDKKTNKNVFRLGGYVNRIDPEGKYIVLSNGDITWSVQIPISKFFIKMSETELRNEIKKEVKEEILTETNLSNDYINEFKKENNMLKERLEQYKELEKRYKIVLEENNMLKDKINSIKYELKNRKK
jgi:hypothetical protein